MKYNIISIDDNRKRYKDCIRQTLDFEEINIPSVDAGRSYLPAEVSRRHLRIRNASEFYVGEIGLWLSTFDCWQWSDAHKETLIVFEDDVMPTKVFNTRVRKYVREAPSDWDFIKLWVPIAKQKEFSDGSLDRNHDTESSILCKNFIRTGNMAMIYSPTGAEKMIRLVLDLGIYTEVDVFVADNATEGSLNGYSPKPNLPPVVNYSDEPTTIRNTKMYREVYT